MGQFLNGMFGQRGQGQQGQLGMGQQDQQGQFPSRQFGGFGFGGGNPAVFPGRQNPGQSGQNPLQPGLNPSQFGQPGGASIWGQNDQPGGGR